MLHAHVNEPTVFVHVAAAAQLSVFRVHSLTSAQVMPFPEYPALQEQEKDPVVSAQFARVAWQLCTPVVHSFTLVQVTPLPEYP